MDYKYFDAMVVSVRKERMSQDDKWGQHRSMADPFWMMVLMEEVGEVARAFLQKSGDKRILDELIQCAAVIFAWAECILEFREARADNKDFKVG
jgi:NTP pyrophosphatase (non-canonical NTP hydrolase)